MSLPHIYRAPRSVTIFFVLFGCFFVADGIFFLLAPIWLYVGHSLVKGSPFEAYLLTTLLGCIGCCIGAMIIVFAVTGHVDLYPDSIVVGSALPFGNRRLERDAIGAKHVLVVYWPSYVLYPSQKGAKKLRVSVWRQDDYFRAWMAGIPDADREFFRRRRAGASRA